MQNATFAQYVKPPISGCDDHLVPAIPIHVGHPQLPYLSTGTVGPLRNTRGIGESYRSPSITSHCLQAPVIVEVNQFND